MFKNVNLTKFILLYIVTMVVSPMFHYVTRNEFKYSRVIWYALYAPMFDEISTIYHSNFFICKFKKLILTIKNDVIHGNRFDTELDIISKALYISFYIHIFVGFDKLLRWLGISKLLNLPHRIDLIHAKYWEYFASNHKEGRFIHSNSLYTHHKGFSKINMSTRRMYNDKIDNDNWPTYFNKEMEYGIPSSSEMRGIIELYSLDMLVLIFIGITIFLLLSKALIWDSINSAYTMVRKKNLKNRLIVKKNIKRNRGLLNIFVEIMFCVKQMYKICESKFKQNFLRAFFFEDVLYFFYRLIKWFRVASSKNSYVSMKTNSSITRLVKYMDTLKSILHWTHLEFAWTLVPCVILLILSVPSFTLALALDETYRPFLWVSVIGNQWFWNYEISNNCAKVELSSVILQGDEIKTNALRLLSPDNVISVPVNKFTRFMISSVDVIHSWAIPGMGVKVDACPGRINSITVLPTKLGVYYGQCSEICGVNHAFMPICVEVVV